MARSQAIFNKDVFRKDLNREPNRLRGLSAHNGRLEFDKMKGDFIDDFNKHPVTQEIETKGETGNISKTLGRIGEQSDEANLWGFIGFQSNAKPIKTLRDYLVANLVGPKDADKAVNTQVTGHNIRFTFRVKVPDLGEINGRTQMPWENMSWVDGVEFSGISGLGAYIYWKTGLSRGQSRSGGKDTQGKVWGGAGPATLRSDNFEVTPYLADMLGRFRNKLSGV